jgi:curli production assembly/transport component CsgG
MQYIWKNLFVLSLAVVLFVFSGCSFMVKQPVKTQSPKVGRETQSGERLKKLPKPQSKVVAAVYNFRDKTGQYKMSAQGGGSWSTAVTQGATAILIQAMEKSGWFIPIERAGLGNLLNERKIIRSSRSAYNQGNSQSQKLPPLMFAGVMLEGGIISYDHNVKTGGAGLRYFGAGGSGEYRQDRVTIYLRAVSTKNGKVLKSVNVTKTVLSQKIDVGVFRYVKFKRLLEAETGVTYNEPTQLVVKSAISKALESLVIEGVFDDIWQLKNPEAINSDIIQSYVKEKEEQRSKDRFGMERRPRPYSYSFRLTGGATQYSGDLTPAIKRPQMNFSFGYRLSEKWHP